MAFFEELGKKAQAVAGVAAEKAKDLAGVASEKAKSVSDSAKASMEIISEQREMEKNYRAIGEWFVSEYEGEVPDAVKDVVAAVIASKERCFTLCNFIFMMWKDQVFPTCMNIDLLTKIFLGHL